MVVDNLNLQGIAFRPHEAHPVLVVDPDAVLARAITLQSLQPIPGKRGKVPE